MLVVMFIAFGRMTSLSHTQKKTCDWTLVDKLASQALAPHLKLTWKSPKLVTLTSPLSFMPYVILLTSSLVLFLVFLERYWFVPNMVRLTWKGVKSAKCMSSGILHKQEIHLWRVTLTHKFECLKAFFGHLTWIQANYAFESTILI